MVVSILRVLRNVVVMNSMDWQLPSSQPQSRTRAVKTMDMISPVITLAMLRPVSNLCANESVFVDDIMMF
jgi:hypothetical protein